MNPQSPATTPKQQAAEVIKNGASIVVTTNKKPSLDEISTVIGLTHMLQAMNKHAVAIVSTTLPHAIEFLKPQAVIEADTKRLQDFVISLHKDKADKLRYKVEDDEVKIFITPYKTVISEKDLAFTSGDYNIDTVVAVGVVSRDQIDDAMLSSPRILGDTKNIVTINAGGQIGKLGSINWSEPEAISVSEMIISISESLGSNLLQGNTAQALLTGLVSVTDQFGNDKTSPKIMTMAAQLMAAGADQQVIVKEIAESKKLKVVNEQPKEAAKPAETVAKAPEPSVQKSEEPVNTPPSTADVLKQQTAHVKVVKDQPTIAEQSEQPTVKPVAEPHITNNPQLATLKPAAEEEPTKPAAQEQKQQPAPEPEHVVAARDAVKQAADKVTPANPEPIKSLNAQPVEEQTSGDIVINHDGEITLPESSKE